MRRKIVHTHCAPFVLGILMAKFSMANQPFQPVDPTGLPYTIVVDSGWLGDQAMINGTQVAVFDGTLCVGASFFEGEDNLQVVAWEGDQQQGLPGFVSGNQMIFKLWVPFNHDTLVISADLQFSQGNGTFGNSTFSVLSLWNDTTFSPSARFDLNSLDFGEVQVGSSQTRTISLSNAGNLTLSVEPLSLQSTQFTWNANSSRLAPGAEQLIEVMFSPDQSENFQIEAQFLTNEIDSDTVSFVLQGTGTDSIVNTSIRNLFDNSNIQIYPNPVIDLNSLKIQSNPDLNFTAIELIQLGGASISARLEPESALKYKIVSPQHLEPVAGTYIVKLFSGSVTWLSDPIILLNE